MKITNKRIDYTLVKGATYLDLPQFKVRFGFTLAEVLITLGIVGVVAALTLPALLTNVQAKIRAEQIRSAKYKFSLATEKMARLNLIGPYDSTDAFVDELQKYLNVVT